MEGGTTTDEPAAANARTSTAPTVQDLQSTIAPQLTTTGSDPANQPEIPETDEATPHKQVKLVDNPPFNWDDLDIPEIELPTLEAWEGLMDCLADATTIATSFIVLVDDSSHLKKYQTSAFIPNQNWIGHLIQP